MMRTLAGFALLAVVSLSGCMSSHTIDENREFVVPKDADAQADQKGVKDPHTVELKVTQESRSGAPIVGAAVVFFRTTTNTQSEGLNTHTEIRHTPLATARTGSDGTVTVGVEPEAAVRILVGDVAGFTRELYDGYLTGPPGGTSRLSVPLFRTALELDFQDSFPLAASGNKATFGNHERVWQNLPLAFSNDTAASTAYLERLLTLQVTLTWENSAGQAADLGVGLAVEQGAPVFESDEEIQYELGAHKEDLVLEPDGVAHLRTQHPADAYTVSAFTDSASLTMDGLPYKFHVEATFQESDFEIRA